MGQKKDLRWWRHVGWADEHFPSLRAVCIPEAVGAWEDAVCGFGFTDIGLVIEEGWVLTVEDLVV